jgi:phage host-nuclease inhibitor protein Gam
MRVQLDETKEIIERLKEGKEREVKRVRDKMEEEKRRETEKYQFEYDKLREEIQLFTRKLG